MSRAHPIQPLVMVDGVLRFQENKAVSAVLAFAAARGFGLNELACGDFSAEDHMQLAQLIGYSLSGYGSLSYVTDESYGTAAAMHDEQLPESEARIAYLETELAAIRSALRPACARLFGVHESDVDAAAAIRARGAAQEPTDADQT